jgi:septum formation topological specificity factor MinE
MSLWQLIPYRDRLLMCVIARTRRYPSGMLSTLKEDVMENIIKSTAVRRKEVA